MERMLFGLVACVVCGLAAETIDVPAGRTERVASGRCFAGDVLVKTGAGTLDLTGARLANRGLEIREGTVRLAGGAAGAITARYLRWNVTKARPAKSAPPEYGNSGSQFSEFRLFRGGKMLPRPKNATALNGRDDEREGPRKGIDGDLKTKCYFNPFIADFGEEVTFDGYSFATANDAPGRDPMSWTVEIGVADGSAISWLGAGSVENFEAPRARFAEVGRIFPIALRDVVPLNYAVTVGGKGRLVLSHVNETLECVSGTGLIQLEDATVDFGGEATFAGSVAGEGGVTCRPAAGGIR